ncbi:hypothetical protein D3C87_1914280 [compost metagenome]
MDPDEDNGVDVRFSGANGIKVGLGFKIYSFSINAEYLDLTYRDSKLEKAGPISGDLNSDFKNKVGVVSLSFPFTL